MINANFDYVIGNPPYSTSIVKEDLHPTYFAKLGRGVKHSALAFFMKAIDNLQDGGSMVYIIPSNGMCLYDSNTFRKYVNKHGSITNIYFTNKNMFDDAVVQGNLFIVKFVKGVKQTCKITTDYANGLSYDAEINYHDYNNGEVFPLILSDAARRGLDSILFSTDKKFINRDDESLSLMMKPGHNNIPKEVIREEPFPGCYRVVDRLNRGRNLKIGYTDVYDPVRTWKVAFSTICKIKELMQNEGIPCAVVEPDLPVAKPYSYIKCNSKEQAEFVKEWLHHPLLVVSLFQLFDNSYISDGNLGRLRIPPVTNIDDVWDHYGVNSSDRKEIEEIYKDLVSAEQSLMRKYEQD